MLNRFYGWYGKTTVRVVTLLIIILGIIGILVTLQTREELVEEEIKLKSVQVMNVAALGDNATIILVGSVESRDQALLESEAAGRVTSVPVKLGDFVSAGAVITVLENASERAAVLQAEGVYEAALAQGASSEISLESAKELALSTYKNIFITADDSLRNLTDELFSSPDSSQPGLKIDGHGSAPSINAERVALGEILKLLGESADLITESNIEEVLTSAKVNIKRVSEFVDLLSSLISREANDNQSSFSDAELASYKTRFLLARTNLTDSLTDIEAAESGIKQARLSSSGPTLSSVDALRKQALGALRAAEANLQKTIVRTPISGTVNQLTTKEGDFVSSFTRIATIANNNALEITTFVGNEDRNRIAVGDSVLIEKDILGIITLIAPAVDPITKKVEVNISTESTNIINGDTVTLSISTPIEEVENPIIRIPLTAVKLTSDRAFVFTVEGGILVEHEVELGKPNGSNVVILSGINKEWNIVIDSRGLLSGREVTESAL